MKQLHIRPHRILILMLLLFFSSSFTHALVEDNSKGSAKRFGSDCVLCIQRHWPDESSSWNPDYLVLNFKRDKIIITGESQKEVFYKRKLDIEGKNEKRYFYYDEDLVLIERDVPDSIFVKIEKYFAERIKLQTEISPHFHAFNMFFLVNATGQIMEKGFEVGVGDDIYLPQILGILKNNELNIPPRIIDGKPVATLYLFKLNLDDEAFRDM